MIWIEVRYTPETVATDSGVEYRVKADVLNSAGIPKEVFVFRKVDDVFQHVAMAYDLNVYPASAALALGDGSEFYRAASATVVYKTSASAASALRNLKARLKVLTSQWNATQTEALGDSEVEVYTAG